MLYTETVTALCLLALMAVKVPKLYKLSFFFLSDPISTVMIETHGSAYFSRVSLLVDRKSVSLVLKLQEPSAAPSAD